MASQRWHYRQCAVPSRWICYPPCRVHCNFDNPYDHHLRRGSRQLKQDLINLAGIRPSLGTGVGWVPMKNPGMGPMRVAHTIMTEMAATSVQPIAFSHSYSLGFSYGMFTYKRLCRHKDQRCKGSQSLRAKSNKRLSRRPDHLEP